MEFLLSTSPRRACCNAKELIKFYLLETSIYKSYKNKKEVEE